MAKTLQAASQFVQIENAFSILAGKVGALVRPDDPPPGIAGYVFEIVESDKVDLTSDITDYVLEDNSFAHDHITLKPEIITVSGLVAEVRDAPSKYIGRTKRQVQALDLISSYTPVSSPASIALGLYNEAERVGRLVDKNIERVQSFFGLFQSWKGRESAKVSTLQRIENNRGQGDTERDYKTYLENREKLASRQMEAYEFFRYLWYHKHRVTVDTPWGVHKSMAIQSITAQQTAQHLSSFQMVFKQIRILGDDKTNASAEATGRAAEAKSALYNLGIVAGVTVAVPFLEKRKPVMRTKKIIQ